VEVAVAAASTTTVYLCGFAYV